MVDELEHDPCTTLEYREGDPRFGAEREFKELSTQILSRLRGRHQNRVVHCLEPEKEPWGPPPDWLPGPSSVVPPGHSRHAAKWDPCANPQAQRRRRHELRANHRRRRIHPREGAVWAAASLSCDPFSYPAVHETSKPMARRCTIAECQHTVRHPKVFQVAGNPAPANVREMQSTLLDLETRAKWRARKRSNGVTELKLPEIPVHHTDTRLRIVRGQPLPKTKKWL